MRGKRGTMLIIIISVIVLLASAAGVAYMTLWRGAPEPAQKKPAPEKTVATYSLGEFLTNLADPGGTRYIRVVIQLGLSDAKAAKKLDTYNPPMRNAVLSVLRSKTYAQVSGSDGMAALAAELKQALNAVLPSPWVTVVYFTDFTVQ